MRIAICGPHRDGAIITAENSLHTTAQKPWGDQIVDYAAETYKHFEETNFIFDGSAFDFLADIKSEEYFDVYEQIALNTLMNLDYIAVITMDMPKDLRRIYEDYAKIYPEKFHIYSSDAEFEVTIA